jgi:2-hydroxychromene-2-carboxylate isomerase
MDAIRFYFSFRSPYSWLAFHRIDRALEGLPVEVRRIPVYPPPQFDNDPAASPVKLHYVLTDVERIAGAYGLSVRWPTVRDTRWLLPHAAYLCAEDLGKGAAFARAVFAARFLEGQDVGDPGTLARLAGACGLDGEALLRAAGDPALEGRVAEGIFEGVREGLFGVPFFVYRDQAFWGNDRLEWLVRAVRLDAGLPVPDLHADPIANPRG